MRRSEPQNWLTYGGVVQVSTATRRSTQINRQNAGQLKLAWAYQMQRPGVVETSPIVVDGVMYLTEPPDSTVTALDTRSGRTLWTYTPNIPPDVIVIGSPPVNRGVAILDDFVYRGHRPRASHRARREVRAPCDGTSTVEDNKHGFYLTLAPLALDGKIIVGVSGAETGIRGFIDAYDAKTGKLVWRTYTIPAPGEPGIETWGKGNGWKTGGGSTWLTGSFDPELNLLYWATGNPAPDWNADNRPGDNLYTDSVLALDPGDRQDEVALPVHARRRARLGRQRDAGALRRARSAGASGSCSRRPIATASTTCSIARPASISRGVPYAKQTWADGLDAKGRPIRKKGIAPSLEGTLVFPNIQGASNWFSPSYSPQTKLFYQAAREMGTIYYKGDAVYKPGTAFTGGGGRCGQRRRRVAARSARSRRRPGR